MAKACTLKLVPFVQIVLLVACGTEPAQRVLAPSAELAARSHGDDDNDRDSDRDNEDPDDERPRFSPWSEPVNLGSVVNSPSGDNDPAISADGLSLFFASDRPGGLGGLDIWVTRRASADSPWEAPVNLGAPINTIGDDATPALSADGHLLFLSSDRDGGQGGVDIWMARRASRADDFGWEAPANLGPDVNTAADERGPAYVRKEDGGALYFGRGSLTSPSDLYRAEVRRSGQTKGPAEPLAELNDPSALDAVPTVRADAQEILFVSTRAGGFGGNDIWLSTRRSRHDLWSPPENWGGPPLNTSSADLQPDLAHDGRTLLFSSNRPGGSGRADLWMSTRTRLRSDHADGEGDGDDLRRSRRR